MKLGVVTGVVWATRKVKEIGGCRLFIVQPVSAKGEADGPPLVVADPRNIGGPGDRVVYVTSTDATQAFGAGNAPVNASIVALVDDIT